MSEGAHPHLKIAELFDVSGLNVAITVSLVLDYLPVPASRNSILNSLHTDDNRAQGPVSA